MNKKTSISKLSIINDDSPSAMHKNHRLRIKEKFLNYGLESLADHEKLEMLLYFSIPQGDVNPLCHSLVKRFGSFNNVLNADYNQLIEIPGIGAHSATLITLIPQLFNAYNKGRASEITKISNHLQAKEYTRLLFAGLNYEEFYVICLDPTNKLITAEKVGSGTFNKVDVFIRKITETAIRNRSDRIILTHNHPEAGSQPSDQDTILTHRIIASCILNDIHVLDHIIISPTDEYSFANKGLIQEISYDIAKRLEIDKTSSIYKKYFLETSTEPYDAL
ncbi:MAG: DNA repair protein RadC [Clostridia bacterium]